MLHLVGDDSVARRVSSWHFPSWWKTVGIGMLALALAAAIVIPALNAVTDLFSRSSQTTSEQAGQGVKIGPASEVNPSAQTKPEVVAPAAPTVVDYRGTWTGVQGFDPFTIPVEEGFYNGTMNNGGWYSTETPEGRAYALKVFPDLKDALGILTAVARDPVDKDVVLLSVFAEYPDKPFVTTRIAFSVDGEKSWCNRDVLPVSRGDAGDVRILADGNLITMYGQDARPGVYWWGDTADKSALPCS